MADMDLIPYRLFFYFATASVENKCAPVSINIKSLFTQGNLWL